MIDELIDAKNRKRQRESETAEGVEAKRQIVREKENRTSTGSDFPNFVTF